MKKLRELREKRANYVQEMRAITDDANNADRDINAAEQKQFDKLKKKLSSIDQQIENAEVLAEAERSMQPINRRGNDGSFDDQCRRFSLLSAIHHAIDPAHDAGLEIEVSQELATRSGRNPTGFFVPHRAMVETRDVLTSGSGAHLIPETHLADQYIDVLRPKLRVHALGATVLSDLQGSIDIPRATAGSATTWVAEHSPVSETTPAFDSVELSPKTVGTFVEVSRRMVISSHPGIEDILRRDLSSAIASEIDKQAIQGDGSGSTPTGILNTTGRNTQSLSTLSWENILEFIAKVEASDASVGLEPLMAALTPGESASSTMGWLTSPHVVKKFRSVIKITNSEHIQTFANQLADYRLVSTTNVPGDPTTSPATDGALIFGDWSQLLVGYWSGIDILVNPFESAVYKRGGILINALQDCDVSVRHAEAFCTSDDVSLA